MKKILFIDDTKENLDAAKAFFSTIPGFEFVYATNRQEAEKHLEEVYAVITDRSLPYSETSLIGCDFPDNEKEDVEYNYVQTNGYYLLLKALSMGKPAIMASDHGGMIILEGKLVPSTQIENFSLEATLQRMSVKPTYEDVCSFFYHANNEATHAVRLEDTRKSYGAERNIFKTEDKAWVLVWEELQKQFN